MENNYQKILGKVRNNTSGLSRLADFIIAFGVIDIVAGIICLFAALGIGGGLWLYGLVAIGSGISLLFFAGVGNAVNDIRIYTIARYETEYLTEEEAEPKDAPTETETQTSQCTNTDVSK